MIATLLRTVYLAALIALACWSWNAGSAHAEDATKPAAGFSAVEHVMQAGLMSGYPDGKFHSEKPVTRAELAHIMNKAFKLDVRDPSHGTVSSVKDPVDVSSNHWARYDIKVAISRGIMKGYGDNRFLPNRTINRAEGYAIIGNAYGVFQFDKDTMAELLAQYPDASQLPDWSVKAVATCLHESFVTTKKYNGQIEPFKPLTRYDVAFALSRYLQRNNTPFYAEPGYDEQESSKKSVPVSAKPAVPEQQ